MIARLQTFITASLLVAAIAWAAAWSLAGHPGWASTGALLILFGYALFLAVEFALLIFVQHAEAAPRPSLGQILTAWSGEIVTAPRVFLWRQPFRSRIEPDHLPAGGARTGVVLVHGFFCNRGLWNPWMEKLRGLGVPFVAVNLEPIFGSIDDYADTIETAVARIEASTGRPAVLIGHSMGGIAIRAWLARFNADNRVRQVVTIGTPHHGTWLARFGHTKNGRQMRQRGPWIADLSSREPAERYAKFTCFFGHCDNIVFPSSAAVLTGAHNIHVPATAHVHMAFSPIVFDTALRWLDDKPPDGPAASSVG
jgi:triacylglycerol esterase/lipase EstA (alpha/beta hydrolase family)